MQLYPSHRPFQSHPIYRHSTTMQWCCGYYWLPQGLELHHYRSYVRTHFAVLQFKILLRMITNMIHMISHTPSSYNIIKIVSNRLEQGPLTCPEHWTVVSQNLEHLTLFFSKPGTPDSADLFLHESYFLKLRQCTLTLKLAGQNLPNEAVDFKHFYLHLHCTTVSLQSGETLLETDNFENIGDSMAKSPKESWQVFERLFHMICIYEHIFSERSSKYVSCIAMRCHTAVSYTHLTLPTKA